jgi:alcohol dehydrogenase class IV
VHGLAGPIGGEIDAPHGAICASLLLNVMTTNIAALRNRAPDHPSLDRYSIIGKLLSGNSTATAEIGIQWVRNFCEHAKIKSLSALSLVENQFDGIIEKSMKSSSMKGNPITLNQEELRTILQMSL